MLMHVISESAPSRSWLLLLTCAVVTATATLAAYLPARRAASIDPTSALRAE